MFGGAVRHRSGVLAGRVPMTLACAVTELAVLSRGRVGCFSCCWPRRVVPLIRCAPEQDAGKATSPAPRPNILLIVPMIWVIPISVPSREIPTVWMPWPEGTRFSDFQVLPACSTRAALLTGRSPTPWFWPRRRNWRITGGTAMPAPCQGVPTMASLLGQAGYRTYLSGGTGGGDPSQWPRV